MGIQHDIVEWLIRAVDAEEEEEECEGGREKRVSTPTVGWFGWTAGGKNACLPLDKKHMRFKLGTPRPYWTCGVAGLPAYDGTSAERK